MDNERLVITSQQELDALPGKFDRYTSIEIKINNSPFDALVINKARENSHVEARENSHVEARGNSHVKAWENSHVEAWENSHVEAMGNSHVKARENSHVEAWGNSHVEAMENSHVEAWENSHVKAWENSHVEAWENSHVEAWENSSTKALAPGVVIEKLKQEATLILVERFAVKIKSKDETAHVIETKRARHDIRSFTEFHNLSPKKKKITLFKVVQPATLTDFYTGTITYKGTVNCPDWDPDPSRECGGGLHLSPTPELALRYNWGGIVLKCEVNVDDIVIYPYDISKVRCRKVKVLGVHVAT